MMSDVATNAPSEVQPSMSLAGRFFGVFYSPGETFAGIARKPDFIFPLVVLIVSSTAVAETMLWKLGAERMVRSSLEMTGSASQLSPEQLDQAARQASGILAITTHVSSVIGVPIFMLILAGLGILILNPLFGSQAGFKTVFSVTCYAGLVRVVGAVMAIPLILFSDPGGINTLSPVPTNLGFFLDPREVSKGLYTLAVSFDLLTFWFLIVLAMGLSRVTRGKVKSRAIFLTFFGLYLVWVLGWAGVSSLF
jgi:hypothetical protein